MNLWNINTKCYLLSDIKMFNQLPAVQIINIIKKSKRYIMNLSVYYVKKSQSKYPGTLRSTIMAGISHFAFHDSDTDERVMEPKF